MGRGRKLTSKDAAIIRITLDMLNGEFGEEASQIMHAHVAAFAEQARLTRKGLKVTVPRPRIGRPQLLVVEKKRRLPLRRNLDNNEALRRHLPRS